MSEVRPNRATIQFKVTISYIGETERNRIEKKIAVTRGKVKEVNPERVVKFKAYYGFKRDAASNNGMHPTADTLHFK